jgi:hypothetical protein
MEPAPRVLREYALVADGERGANGESKEKSARIAKAAATSKSAVGRNH